MGGHGGLNILPQKKWNVYNQDNRDKVLKDEAAHAAELEAKRRKHAAAESEHRLKQLRGMASSSSSSSSAASPSSHSAAAGAYGEDDDESGSSSSSSAAAAPNPEAERERKAADDKEARLMTMYLGQGSVELTGNKPFWMKPAAEANRGLVAADLVSSGAATVASAVETQRQHKDALDPMALERSLRKRQAAAIDAANGRAYLHGLSAPALPALHHQQRPALPHLPHASAPNSSSFGMTASAALLPPPTVGRRSRWDAVDTPSSSTPRENVPERSSIGSELHSKSATKRSHLESNEAVSLVASSTSYQCGSESGDESDSSSSSSSPSSSSSSDSESDSSSSKSSKRRSKGDSREKRGKSRERKHRDKSESRSKHRKAKRRDKDKSLDRATAKAAKAERRQRRAEKERERAAFVAAALAAPIAVAAGSSNSGAAGGNLQGNGGGALDADTVHALRLARLQREAAEKAKTAELFGVPQWALSSANSLPSSSSSSGMRYHEGYQSWAKGRV